MGRHRPIRLVFAAAAVPVALWAGSLAGGQPGDRVAAAAIVQGTVNATGWSDDVLVDHPDVGIYRLALRGVDVTSWDGVAEVTIIPLGGGATEVRFRQGGEPVDVGFSYTAVAR